MIYKVVFDIDDMLCTHRVKTIHDVAFFKKHGAVIVAAQKAHYVFPGVKELMRATFNRPDVEVAFYSATEGPRNDEFVKELLKQSNVNPRYLVQVISKVFANNEEERIRDRDLYDVNFGRESKDLSIFVREGLPLGNITLVDNGTTVVKAGGQIKNQLLVNTTSFSDFLMDDPKHWDKDGHQYYKAHVVSTLTQRSNIEVVKQDDGVAASFFNEKGEKVTHVFTDAWAKDFPFAPDSVVPKESPLFEAIERQGGKTKEIPYDQNRICYLTGMLWSSIEQAKKDKVWLSDVLFEKQFVKRGNKWDRKCPYFEDNDIHHLGLSILRETNKDYAFMNPHIVAARKDIPITEDEKKEFQAYLDNQYDACLIM